MLSSLSSTIITVFGISHLLERSVRRATARRVACPTSDSAARKLVPIRYTNANSDLRSSIILRLLAKLRAPLLDHLVGAGEQCRWDPETYALARWSPHT